MASRTFTLDVQHAFGSLSGDVNPMHIDPVAARRLMFGTPVVHGIHALLWALDGLCQKINKPFAINRLDVSFESPILLNETITGEAAIPEENQFQGEVRVGDRICLEYSGETVPRGRQTNIPDRPPETVSCDALTFEEASKAGGEAELAFHINDARQLFPCLAGHLDAMQLAWLLASTRIVGMKCPGQHSLYSKLSLRRLEEGSATVNQVRYAVDRSDARFSRLVIQVAGAGLEGCIIAFHRPPPVRQAGMADLAERMGKDEFARVRALVVGGSRGMGEAAAKLLAGGGGDVLVTYHQGRDDAERVVHEIKDAGGKARAIQYNAVGSLGEIHARLADVEAVNGLLYFASPRIERRMTGHLEPECFRRMCSYYVEGFAAAASGVWRADRPLAILYPSTVFLDESNPDFPEYVAAKAAGEAISAVLERRHPGMRIFRPRFPRVRTDQTSSLMGGEAEDPVNVLLPVLRDMARYL